MRIRLLVVMVILAFVTVGMSQTAKTKSKAKMTPAAAQGAKAEKGNVAEAKKEFDAKCVSCHGKDGTGNTTMGKNLKVPDLTSSTVQNMSDEELEKVIANGKGKMPAYKSLGAAKVKGLVAYTRSLKK